MRTALCVSHGVVEEVHGIHAHPLQFHPQVASSFHVIQRATPPHPTHTISPLYSALAEAAAQHALLTKKRRLTNARSSHVFPRCTSRASVAERSKPHLSLTLLLKTAALERPLTLSALQEMMRPS